MSGESGRQFGIVDYSIFAINIVLCAAIGIYHACVQPDSVSATKNFFMANRELRVLPLTISLVVSVVSAVTLLGLPAEMYLYGSQYVFNIGSGIGILLTAFIFVPLLHPLKLTSMFEYLEKRFNSKFARLAGSALEVFSLLLYGGTALFAPAVALEGVTPFPAWSLVLVMGGLVTFYTSLGGLRAVIWTDMLQAFIMLAGILACLIQGCLKLGGLSQIWEANMKGGRLEFYNFDPDPRTRHTFWGLTAGFAMGSLSFYGASQFTFQRFSATKTLKDARITVLLNLPMFYLFHLLLCGIGLIIYAFYHLGNCDPLANKDITSANQLLPFFIMDIFHHLPGLPGLFVAALTSGALSTVSSILNSVATLIWEDFMKERLHFLSEIQATWVVKCIVIVCGTVAVGLSFLADNFGPHIFQVCFAFLGATGGPQLGMFLLGALVPWANAKGAISGCVAGIAMTAWITIGSYITKPFTTQLPSASTSGCLGNMSITMTTDYNTSLAQLVNTSSVTLSRFPSTFAPELEREVAQMPLLQDLYQVSYTWYTMIGVLTCMVIGLLVSWLTGCQDEGLQHPGLVLPWYTQIRQSLCFCGKSRGDQSYDPVNIHVAVSPKVTGVNGVKASGTDEETSV